MGRMTKAHLKGQNSKSKMIPGSPGMAQAAAVLPITVQPGCSSRARPGEEPDPQRSKAHVLEKVKLRLS